MDRIKLAISKYIESLQELHDLNILVNRHSFTNQIGEWLVATIFDGDRAKSGIQASWDVFANNKYIQVKTHAKAKTNNAKFSVISSDCKYPIDELIIINFNQRYKIIDFYQIPWKEAAKNIKFNGKLKPREELNWRTINAFKVNLDDLPKQEIVALFR